MISSSSVSARQLIPFNSLFTFLIITFTLAWSILALFILLPNQMTEVFGELTGRHPLFYMAVYSPAIAALIVVIRSTGIRGMRSFLSRLFIWRCSLSWYAFLVIGIPLLFFGGSAWKGNLLTESFPFSSLQSLLAAFALTIIKGPIEEFGWRGVCLPLLQRKVTPIWAALILGLVWGFWHLPAFLLSGTQQGAWSFTPFLIGTVAISVIMTPLFNASHGSILLPALMHFQLINPLWPDAQPYDTIFFVAAAGLVVWFNRKTMFIRDGAFTEVVTQTESPMAREDAVR